MNRRDSFCGADAPRWTRQGNPILMYHKIGHAPLRARLRALYVSERLLRRQVDQLEDTLRVARFPGEMREAKPRFSLTFDDGYRSVFAVLTSSLRSGHAATVYLVAGKLGGWNDWDPGEPREPLMDEGEVGHWLAAGHRIGSHTLTHPRLTELTDAAAREELRASRALLEDKFQRPVTDFCYPYGAYDERIRDLVADAGYETAVTVRPGVVFPDTDPLQLPRLLARHRWPGPGTVLSRLLSLLARR